MVTISKISLAHSHHFRFDTYQPIRMSVQDFEEHFGSNHTSKHLVYMNSHVSSMYKSITSFAIGDCMTVFAAEKEANKIKTIIGWSFNRDAPLSLIKNSFEKYTSSDRDYDLLIIGGDTSTTKQKGCLLDRIVIAINRCFDKDLINIFAFLNLNMETPCNYIDVNVQIDGTISYCQY